MMDVIFYNLAILLVFLLSIVLWVRSRRPIGYPPGPPPIPVIGNMHNIAKGHVLETFRELRTKYGDIFSLSIGQFWVVVVNGTENLRELLVKNGQHTSDRPPFYLMKLLGNKGIVSSSGSNWKHQRSFALAKLRGFGFGKKHFESSIMEEIEAFLKLLSSYKREPFDLTGILNTSMANNVMSITIGRRFDYDDPEFNRFIDVLNDVVSNPAVSGPVNFVPLLSKIPGDPFAVAPVTKKMDILFDYFRKEIKEHIETLDDCNIRDFTDAYVKEMKKHEASDSTSYYSEDQLLSVLVDLFGGGAETTATTIRWTILYLMHHEDVQSKMWKEIDNVVGVGRLPCLSDRPNLPYCEAVIHESLRIGNIAPLSLPHLVTGDVHCRGFRIPKGSVIFPCLDSVAHDEKLFPNSHDFKPERFIDTDGKLYNQDTVLTFSLGRRICPGESLARIELFLYLTTLVQRFEFLPPEGEGPPPIEAILATVNGPKPYKVRAIPRS